MQAVQVAEYKKLLTQVNHTLSQKKSEVSRQKTLNDERLDLENELQETTALQTYTNQIKLANKTLHDKVYNEDKAFKQRRLNFLSSVVTEYISEVFPDRGFTAKLECTFSYGDVNPNLKLFDRLQRQRIITLQEGMFLQSLISYAATIGMIESLGVKILYSDEAFSVSDPENLGKVAELKRFLLGRINQIIEIEQSNAGYKNLPRREIHLEYDPLTDSVVTPPVILDF